MVCCSSIGFILLQREVISRRYSPSLPKINILYLNIDCCYKFDLSGRLVDTGIAEAVALNAFVIEEPIIPYQCTGSTVYIS
jgi:hypothetical protein